MENTLQSSPIYQDNMYNNEIFLDVDKISRDISYRTLIDICHVELEKILTTTKKPTALKTSVLRALCNSLFEQFEPILRGKSQLRKELFILYNIVLSFDEYNKKILQFSQYEYRQRVLYPNVFYIMIRVLSQTSKFLLSCVRSVFGEFERKSAGVVKNYLNSFYIDKDIIKNDIQYDFLGSGIKKLSPLEVNDLKSYYKSIYRNILYFYFKREHKFHTKLTTFSMFDDIQHSDKIERRLKYYRDVYYELQLEKIYKSSPTLDQLSYNFGIFRNIIVNNEFQDIYFSCRDTKLLSQNNEFKLIKLYTDDISKNPILDKIKKLRTIYRLLKCVHINDTKRRAYNVRFIKYENVKVAVLEELMHPFKNLMNEEYLMPVLERISENFVSTILTGEYINLMNFSSVYIEQPSFITQLKKFVRICLNEALS